MLRGTKVKFNKVRADGHIMPKNWGGKIGYIISSRLYPAKKNPHLIYYILNEKGDEMGPLVIGFEEGDFEVLEPPIELGLTY